MAKKLPTNRSCQIIRKDDAWHLRFVSWGAPEDTVDATIRYQCTGTDIGPRALTGGELSSTLQAFLDDCDDAIKTAEGIA
jgi:hypothetical protein